MGSYRNLIGFEVGKLFVEPRHLLLRRGRKPVDCAQDDTHAGGLHFNGGRRPRFGFDGVLDGADQNRVLDNGDDHASRGEIRHQLLPGLAGRLLGNGAVSGNPGGWENSSGENRYKWRAMQQPLHRLTIPYRTGCATAVHPAAISSKMWRTVWIHSSDSRETVAVSKGGDLRSPSSIRHKGKRLSEILEAHHKFIRGDETGSRADLTGADLSRADLAKANLAYVNFQGANLEGASLREARLSSADLGKCRLRRADLRKADLTEANLEGADLTEAQVGGAELFRANLRQAVLRRADFGATNFRDADIAGADFQGAGMRTAILRETNLDAVDLSGLDLSTALLPRGYKPPSTAKN